MTRQQARIAGRQLAWLQAGQGTPVLLLHAFPVKAEMWRPQLDAVPHGWRLIAPDLPGFGESRGGPAATTVDDHADAMLALLRHLDIEQAVIGGLSMGGYITFAMYRKAPQRFRAMVLADTRADADSAETRAAREQMQAAVREKGSQAAADAMLPKLLAPHSRAGAPGAAVLEWILQNEPQGIIDALDTLKSRPDSTPALATIACPTLVIVGEKDEATPVALSETMAQKIAGAALTIVPEAGHLSNVEQPDAFNRALWSFVTPRVA